MRTPKNLHITNADTSGRFSVVALCGRLVNRMSLVGPEEATCKACLRKAGAAA